jgi:hypothetical protein
VSGHPEWATCNYLKLRDLILHFQRVRR